MKRLLLVTILGFLSLGLMAQAVNTLNEDFEGGIPAGWTIINANEGVDDNGDDEHTWYHHATYGHMGTGCIALDTHPGPADDWLITPLVSLSNEFILSFWAKASGSYPDDLSIFASKTGTAIGDFTITVVADSTIEGGYDYYEFVPTENADLSAGDEVYLAFYVGTHGSYFDLDDVFYGEEPVKISMAAQTVDNGTGSTVTAQSNFGEGSIYIVLDGEPQGTLAELNAAVSANKGAMAAVNTADTDVTASTLLPSTFLATASRRVESTPPEKATISLG